MNCLFPSFDPDAEQEPPTQQQLQLPLKESLDQSKKEQATSNEQQSEGIDLPSTANQSEEDSLKEITSNQPTREGTNSPSTSTANQSEDEPLKEIMSYQPSREETNSPSTLTTNQSEEEPLKSSEEY
ncbi:uncharacterized protein [Clytia hemisphaerica]|uniref:uncharacterized protein n=1 Tax=Clytia hemisphaerica TaxID=252671 RepID=UPI0034D49C4B